MEAGRELDAEVAEKVMGAERATSMGDAIVAVGELPYYRFPFGFVRGVPHYSTNIAAAWQVVEKVQHDYVISLEFGCWPKSNLVLWRVCLRDAMATVYEAYAPKSPLAICRAALKAVAQDSPTLLLGSVLLDRSFQGPDGFTI
jgi:hypothetical protein